MIKSMTGFAALTREDELAAINVTLRAVNHRYLDLQLRVPTALADQEQRIRGLVQQVVARGRVEVSVSMQPRRPALPEVELNGYIAEKTPFESWQEFLVAAYEHQATTDEIEALLDRDYQTA